MVLIYGGGEGGGWGRGGELGKGGEGRGAGEGRESQSESGWLSCLAADDLVKFNTTRAHMEAGEHNDFPHLQLTQDVGRSLV